MKARRNIYFIIAITLIFLNLLIDITELYENNSNSQSLSYSVGYFIGSHFLIIIGLILLRMSYKLHKKIKSKEDILLDKSIDSIGNS
jgi:peptidoglycan biosynthesis protein MviN/MurJ (putative lipid II flippase)